MEKYFLIILLVLSLCSCNIDCEKATNAYRIDDIEVILTKKPTINAEMKFTGTKLNSSEIKTIEIEGRWYRNYKNYMEIGDTIIKRIGELNMYIHKKDTTLIFKHECQGKIYE